MKAKVIKKFKDRFNLKNVYEIGSIFEGDEKRVAELEAGGWVEAIPEEKPKPKRTRTRKSE